MAAGDLSRKRPEPHSDTVEAMNEERVDDLRKLFAETARAHHQATGGVNPGWANWYAGYLEPRIGNHLGTDLPRDTLAAWLTEADEAQRSQAPDTPWPAYYAQFFLDKAGEA